MENQVKVTRKSRPVLVATGAVFLVLTAILAARIVWEQTYLTIRYGPQMIGFSLAHGYAAPLLLAPLLTAGWFLTALIISIVDQVKQIGPGKLLLGVMAGSLLALSTLALPGVFWQYLCIDFFVKSPHAADLMTYDAAEGHVATARAYLDHKVPIESVNNEGSTAAFTAAAGGSVDVLKLLAARGANLNAINSYGDSPLEAAVENKHAEAAQFLRDHEAKQIAGTQEQRNAASKSIVDKEIKREESLK